MSSTYQQNVCAALVFVALATSVVLLADVIGPVPVSKLYAKTNVFTYDLVVHQMGYPFFDETSCVPVVENNMALPPCPTWDKPIVVIPGDPVPRYCNNGPMCDVYQHSTKTCTSMASQSSCVIKMDRNKWISSYKVGYVAFNQTSGLNQTIMVQDERNVWYTYAEWPQRHWAIIYEKTNVTNHVDSWIECKNRFGFMNDHCNHMFE